MAFPVRYKVQLFWFTALLILIGIYGLLRFTNGKLYSETERRKNQIGRLAKANAIINASISVVNKNTRSPQNSDHSPAVPQAAKWLDKMNLEAPGYKEALRKFYAADVDLTWARFFQHTALTESQAAKLRALITDANFSEFDVADVTKNATGDTENADPRSAALLVRQEIDRQIAELLGDGNYRAYRDYLVSTDFIGAVKAVEARVRFTGDRLSPDQSAKLQTTFGEWRLKYGKGVPSDLNSTQLLELSAFLKPSQLDAVQAMIESKRAEKYVIDAMRKSAKGK